MKAFATLALALAALVQGHAIMQTISINGQDMGKLVGLRAPSTNFPVQDVYSPDLTCGQAGTKDGSLLSVPAGATIGGYWWTNINGEYHVDNPIAASHKGPVTAWLAKVDDAVNTPHTDLNWFKVAEDNLDTATNTWGVDNVISGNGWHSFVMPACIAPGQYLLRIELLALHGASSTGEAQFYGSCAQIDVTGSGTFTPTETAKIPGSYSPEDPSIKVGIYDGNGQPTNGGQPYQAPGMRPIIC